MGAQADRFPLVPTKFLKEIRLINFEHFGFFMILWVIIIIISLDYRPRRHHWVINIENNWLFYFLWLEFWHFHLLALVSVDKIDHLSPLISCHIRCYYRYIFVVTFSKNISTNILPFRLLKINSWQLYVFLYQPHQLLIRNIFKQLLHQLILSDLCLSRQTL